MSIANPNLSVTPAMLTPNISKSLNWLIFIKLT